MAEDLEKYLTKNEVRCRYIHSDVDTLERVEIIEDFKAGRFDVLVGVNLLREGLDLPSVSLVAILDADKEGFLRSDRALTQTAGRAARNINGRVIFYADTITGSMQATIDETNRRRAKQQAYNEEHHIIPHQVGTRSRSGLAPAIDYKEEQHKRAAFLQQDPIVAQMDRRSLEKMIAATKASMEAAAAELDFINAARFRDEMNALKELLSKK
jgi:excinuclease ABC subunit B